MNLKDLSNDQLFKLFKLNGIECGPITHNTRSVYEMKLKKFFKGKVLTKYKN